MARANEIMNKLPIDQSANNTEPFFKDVLTFVLREPPEWQPFLPLSFRQTLHRWLRWSWTSRIVLTVVGTIGVLGPTTPFLPTTLQFFLEQQQQQQLSESCGLLTL